MESINFPIIIAEGLDVQFYGNVSDAELKLEPIDVKNDVYKGYDAQGKPLRLETDGFQISIAVAENVSEQKEELISLLNEFLQIAEEDTDAGRTNDLSYLIELCKKFIYSPPQSHWDAIKKMFRR